MFLKGSLKLKRVRDKDRAKFQKFGNPWVYSNELEKIDKTLEPGSWVELKGADDAPLGYGHFNPRSLIAYRSFSRNAFESTEKAHSLFFEKLDAAWHSRQRIYASKIQSGSMGSHSFRLCFGESDGLPGLVIDLFEGGPNGVAVLQCHSAGADSFIPWAKEWLADRMKIQCGVARNDLDVRDREGVEQGVGTWGKLPFEIFALEGGVKFAVDVMKGQKTGYFYDHRDNRAILSQLTAQEFAGAKAPITILDCFSYTGSWGLQALKACAVARVPARLTAIDISSSALKLVESNAEGAKLSDAVDLLELDWFKQGRKLRESHALAKNGFDVVVCDPPSLTSSSKHAAEGRRALENAFESALLLAKPGGLVALASCSYHLKTDEFLEVCRNSAFKAGVALQEIAFRFQSADHPILASLVETRYLKCLVARARLLDRY